MNPKLFKDMLRLFMWLGLGLALYEKSFENQVIFLLLLIESKT